MSRMNSTNMKNVLTLQKEKLLEELKYYEMQVEEAKLKQIKHIEYEESSDSDTDLPMLTIEPSITDLKIGHSRYQTCFEATQELTGLHILQSEMNVLVEDPKYDGEPLVTEEGLWREVTIECRVDLVPFAMSFYVHQPSRRFGGQSYRGLKITLVKKPHEVELANSILHEVKRPSEAFEVLKAYSSASRSRRTTLSQLATSLSSALHMVPLADGGYQLNCGNLLEITWTLQNKSSPVAPFHHKMKFDLEYMDEAHIHTIMAAHKALSDPTIDTNERTTLLSKIISVCLEVQGINPLESTSESEAIPSKSDLPTKRKRDEETMAPPKAPPKKSRPKGKENKEENRLNAKSDRDNDIGGASSMGSVGNEANTGSKTSVAGNQIGKSKVNGHSSKKPSEMDRNQIVKSKEREHIANKIGANDKRSKNTDNNIKNKGAEVVKEVSESNRRVLGKNSAKDRVSNQIYAKSKENGDVIANKAEIKNKKGPDNAVENDKGVKEIDDSNKKGSNIEVRTISKENNIEVVKKVGEVNDRKRPNNVIDKNNVVKESDDQNVKTLKTKEKKGSSEIIVSKHKNIEGSKGTNTNKIGKDVRVNERQVDNINRKKAVNGQESSEIVPSKNKNTEVIERTNLNKLGKEEVRLNERQNENIHGKKSTKSGQGSCEVISSKNKDTEGVKATNLNKNGKGEVKANERQAENTLGKKPTMSSQVAKNNQREFKKNNEQIVDKTSKKPNLVEDNQNTNKHADKVKQKKVIEKEYPKKPTKDQNIETKKDGVDRPKNPESTLKKTTNSVSSDLNTKLLKYRFSNRKSRDMNNIILNKNTKIPQKATGSIQKVMKKNPLRISPRKSITLFKGISPKFRKPFTHIPRLVTKPVVK